MGRSKVTQLETTLAECNSNIDNLLDSLRKLKEVVSTTPNTNELYDKVAKKLYDLKCEEIAEWVTEFMFTSNSKGRNT